jgi:DNA-binding NarL/FixJ family response regulator
MEDSDIAVLRGLNVLLVEDEPLVAMALIDELEQAGITVVGPAASLEGALALVAESRIDAAILDVELQRKLVFPAADLLAERGVPFILTTGHDAEALPERYADVPNCPKPAIGGQVLAVLAQTIAARG